MRCLLTLLTLFSVLLPAHAGLDWTCKPDEAIQLGDKWQETTTVYPCQTALMSQGASDIDWWYDQAGNKVPAPAGRHGDELIYEWTSGAPGFVDPGNTEICSWAVPFGTPAGNYTISLAIHDKPSHSGGDDPDPDLVVFTFTVALPTLTIQGPAASICPGEAAWFTATLDPSGCEDHIQWSGGGDPPTNTGPAFQTAWDQPGTYTVTATMGGVTATKTVVVKQPIISGIDGPSEVCPGSTACFSAVVDACPDTVNWSGGGVPPPAQRVRHSARRGRHRARTR